jgi:quinol monooxygenase YgiN
MKSVEEENHVVLVEVYENDEPLESHCIFEHMAQYLEQVDDMIGERQRYRCEC